MNAIQVTPEIPSDIKHGLDTGRLERVGGAIVDLASKEVLAWLREGCGELGRDFISEVVGVAAASPNTAAFNLAISTMGFAVVMKHLNTIEKELQRTQEVLNIINYKIDLSFYANFRAAVDLASNAFMMQNLEMRKATALQAIERFLVAQHHYLSLADIEIANGSPVADDFLSTASLAYVAEARCYLQLEETATAGQRLLDGLCGLRPRYVRHIRTLLTSNPAAYLHPCLADEVSLARLTRVFQWFEPGIDQNDVFQRQRTNMFDLARQPKKWIESLPQAVYIPKPGMFDQVKLADLGKQLRGIFSPEDLKNRAFALPQWLNKDRKNAEKAAPAPDDADAVFRRLPQCMDLIETMIENFRRFEAYQFEVQAMQRLGVSFHEWIELAPEVRDRTRHPVMWIVAPAQTRPM